MAIIDNLDYIPVAYKKFRSRYQSFNHHRSGSRVASAGFDLLSQERGIFLNGFAEYMWTNNKYPTEPWIGVFHHTPFHPRDAGQKYRPPRCHSLSELVAFKPFRTSLELCRGIYTMSKYTADYLKTHIENIPISWLYHPVEDVAKKFDFDKFIANQDRKIVLIGHWMRRWEPFYKLAFQCQGRKYEKIILPGDPTVEDRVAFQTLEARHKGAWPGAGASIKTLSNQDFDDLLESNIAFLDLWDAGANNAVIDCLIRRTPLLVNKVGGVIDYLGVDYPFYWETYEEALEKAQNLSLIKKTSEYMKELGMGQKLSLKYFVNSIIQSEVFQSLTNEQPTLRPKDVEKEIIVVKVRDNPKHLTSIKRENNTVGILLPNKGYNGSIVKYGNKYICVYRSQEFEITACVLNEDFSVDPASFFVLNHAYPVDPRLYWAPNGDLLVIYACPQDEHGQFNQLAEHMRGARLLDGEKIRAGTARFENNPSFRISPPMPGRQKNWMPFTHKNTLYFIASVCPHIIYQLEYPHIKAHGAKKVYQTDWKSLWWLSSQDMLKGTLRGNTNAIRLKDGTYLSTFHSVTNQAPFYYDNGCYIFDGKPPFRVLRCGVRTFLRGEDATLHPRWPYAVAVFPTSMILNNDDNLTICYGENDDGQRVVFTKVSEMLDTTMPVTWNPNKQIAKKIVAKGKLTLEGKATCRVSVTVANNGKKIEGKKPPKMKVTKPKPIYTSDSYEAAKDVAGEVKRIVKSNGNGIKARMIAQESANPIFEAKVLPKMLDGIQIKSPKNGDFSLVAKQGSTAIKPPENGNPEMPRALVADSKISKVPPPKTVKLPKVPKVAKVPPKAKIITAAPEVSTLADRLNPVVIPPKRPVVAKAPPKVPEIVPAKPSEPMAATPKVPLIVKPRVGIVTATDKRFFATAQLLCSSVPYKVCVYDLGMTDSQRSWCERQNNVRLFHYKSFASELIFGRGEPYWQIWNKPLFCRRAPFDKFLWIDADCLVFDKLDYLFGLVDKHPVFMKDNALGGSIDQLHELMKTQIPDKRYPINSGIIGFSLPRDVKIINDWMAITTVARKNQKVRAAVPWCDQGLLQWVLETKPVENVMIEDQSWNNMKFQAPVTPTVREFVNKLNPGTTKIGHLANEYKYVGRDTANPLIWHQWGEVPISDDFVYSLTK